jgi:flagella basal body P-ring formation protein FlgA
VRSIVDRVGAGASIRVDGLETSVAPEAGLLALPDPAGRAGHPMRFVLMAGRVRRGVATATVSVSTSYARATRAIARNERVDADAFEVIDGEIPGGSLKRLPAAETVAGRIARRDIAPGEVLSPAVLQVPPDVRAGEPVTLTVVVGVVRISTKAVASASGHEGDIVRVVPEGGRSVKARVTGPGAVEIRQ